MLKRIIASISVCLAYVIAVSGQTSPERARPVLLDQIRLARLALADETVNPVYGTVGTRRVRIGRRSYKNVPITGVVGREMALAVLTQDGGIKIVRALKRDNQLETLTPNVVLSLRRDNGINSDIACIVPAGGKVLALKYPVLNERYRFGPGPELIQAIYTPYSAEIKTRELVKHGLDVQSQLIDKAYARLAEAGVFSRAFPGEKIGKVIPKDVLMVLLLNEHIDPSEFRSREQTKPLVDRVLTIIATNQEKAYAYSISPANARGLVQMIPSTYARMVNLYPLARLNPSFALGVGDAVNAIMAQILLCDSDWHSIRLRQDVPADRIGPYLAAAYNGGVGRVLTVLTHEENEWMENPESGSRPTVTVSKKVPIRVRTRRGRMQTTYVVKRYTSPIFRAETDKYIRQYHWIADFLSD